MGLKRLRLSGYTLYYTCKAKHPISCTDKAQNQPHKTPNPITCSDKARNHTHSVLSPITCEYNAQNQDHKASNPITCGDNAQNHTHRASLIGNLAVAPSPARGFLWVLRWRKGRFRLASCVVESQESRVEEQGV